MLNFITEDASAAWAPIAGDWNGDGIDSVALYDSASQTFMFDNDPDGGVDATYTPSGAEADWLPIAGDWNDDGTDEVGLYDRFEHTFHFYDPAGGTTESEPAFTTPPVPAGWLPLAGDWDSLFQFPDDGSTADSVGLYNPTGHTFYLNDKIDGSTDRVVKFVTPPLPASWKPLVGDWNGNGKDTVGVYDPNGHTFYLNDKIDGSTNAVTKFVTPPLPASWPPLAGDWDGSNSGIMMPPAATALAYTPDGGDPEIRHLDINGDDSITPLDALILINALNAGELTPVDPTGDAETTPRDALMVINHLNRQSAEAEADSVAADVLASPVTETTDDSESLAVAADAVAEDDTTADSGLLLSTADEGYKSNPFRASKNKSADGNTADSSDSLLDDIAADIAENWIG